MITLADRVRETTETVGVGAVDLAGAEVGFQTFVAGAGDGAIVYYCIVGQAGGAALGEWETGIGTVTDAAPDTLSRTTVLDSSNGGAAVNFPAGTKDVFLTVPAAAPVVGIETIDFTAVANVDIDIGGYEAVHLVGWMRPVTDGADPQLLFSNDGGASFRTGAADYIWAYYYLVMDNGANGDAFDGSAAFILMGDGTGNLADEQISLDFKVSNHGAAGAPTSVVGTNLDMSPTPQLVARTLKGAVNTAEVNDALRLKFSAGNIAAGRVTVYGYPAP